MSSDRARTGLAATTAVVRRCPSVVAIAVAAALVRVVYVVVVKRDDPLAGDQLYYAIQAQLLADGRGFVEAFTGMPAADHPPLTSLVMTPAALLAPGSVLAQRCAMAVLGGVVVLLTGVLAGRIAGRRAAVAAATISALYPNLWVNDTVIMAETPAAVCLGALLLAVERLTRGPTLPLAAFAGALVGLAGLARSELVVLGPVLVVPVLWRAHRSAGRSGAAPGRASAVAGAACLVTLAPWVGPNLVRFEHPVLLSTNDGLTLYGANCEDTYRGPLIGYWSLPCGLASPPPAGSDQSEAARWYASLARAYASEHAERLPLVVTVRILRAWNLWGPGQQADVARGEGRTPFESWAGFATFWVLAPVAAAGAIALRRVRHPMAAPLLTLPAVVTVLAAAFYGIPRLRLPAELAIVVLAAVALAPSRTDLRLASAP